MPAQDTSQPDASNPFGPGAILAALQKALSGGGAAQAAPAPQQSAWMAPSAPAPSNSAAFPGRQTMPTTIAPGSTSPSPLQNPGSPSSQLPGSASDIQGRNGLLLPTSPVGGLDLSQVGKTADNKSDSNRSSSEGSSSTSAIDDKAYGTAYGRMADGTPGLAGEQADLGTMRAAAAPYAADEASRSAFQRADLSPLNNFFSSLAGKNVNPNYKAPVEALAPLIAATSALTKGGQGLASGQQQLFDSQLQNKATQTQGAAQGSSAGAGFNGMQPFQVGQSLSENVGKEAKLQTEAGLQPLSTNLNVVNQLAAKYGGSLPGYRQLPTGTWVRVGNQALGKFSPLGPDELRDSGVLDSAMQGIKNSVNHQNFGARQTEYETGATGKMLGDYAHSSPSLVLNGLKKMQTDAATTLAARQGTYMPTEQQMIKGNGAMLTPDKLNYSLNGTLKQDPNVVAYAAQHKDMFGADPQAAYRAAKAVLQRRGVPIDER
jgi:hypothetical protein